MRCVAETEREGSGKKNVYGKQDARIEHTYGRMLLVDVAVCILHEHIMKIKRDSGDE